MIENDNGLLSETLNDTCHANRILLNDIAHLFEVLNETEMANK